MNLFLFFIYCIFKNTKTHTNNNNNTSDLQTSFIQTTKHKNHKKKHQIHLAFSGHSCDCSLIRLSQRKLNLGVNPIYTVMRMCITNSCIRSRITFYVITKFLENWDGLGYSVWVLCRQTGHISNHECGIG